MYHLWRNWENNQSIQQKSVTTSMSTSRGMARLQRKPAIVKNYIHDRRQVKKEMLHRKKGKDDIGLHFLTGLQMSDPDTCPSQKRTRTYTSVFNFFTSKPDSIFLQVPDWSSIPFNSPHKTKSIFAWVGLKALNTNKKMCLQCCPLRGGCKIDYPLTCSVFWVL